MKVQSQKLGEKKTNFDKTFLTNQTHVKSNTFLNEFDLKLFKMFF